MANPEAITALPAGTVQATDVYPATDITDPTATPSGTTKKYTIADLAIFISGGGIPITLTGAVTGSGLSTIETSIGDIGDNVITNTNLSQVPSFTVKGNNTLEEENVIDLTVEQLNTMTGLTAVGQATIGQIPGVTDAIPPSSGNVGQIIKSSILFASRIACNSATNTDITSVQLTAGNWMVYGNINLNYTFSSSNPSQYSGWLNTVSATPPDMSQIYDWQGTITNLANVGFTVPVLPQLLAGNQTIYLTCNSVTSVGTFGACGSIIAIRIS